MKTKVQIFIPTYNRPNLILKSLNSVLRQSFLDYKITISDNSTNDLTKKIFESFKNDKVYYKKREQTFSGIEHLNIILNEIDSEYFIIFHDDDIMHPNMLQNLYNFLTQNDSLVAVGCNAKVDNYQKIRKVKFGNFKKNIIVDSPMKLLNGYINTNIYVPFPSYMYKKIISEKLRIEVEKGGKYSDLAFLVDVLKFGKIAFLSKPLMTYYIHKDQDTTKHDFIKKAELIKHLQLELKLKKDSKIVKKMRSQNLYMHLKYKLLNNFNTNINRKNTLIILKYLGLESYLKFYFFYFTSKFKKQ